MPLSELTFLVLSDIHFGTLAEHQDFALPGTALNSHAGYSESMKSHLIKVVRDSGVQIEAILVPGDLTSRACPSEFKGCWEIIKEIAAGLNVHSDRIFHTYGNHDTNWRICALGRETEDYSADENYNMIAAVTGDLFCGHSANLVPGLAPGSGVFRSETWDLFIANSGYFCTDLQEIKHGKLGQDQLKWLEKELEQSIDIEKWRVLMVHHHPFNSPYPVHAHDISFLEEGDALQELIGKYRVDLVCYGHRHHPILKTRMEGGWKSPCTFFCAGSVSVNSTHRAAGNIKNMFHLVSISERHAVTKGALGKVDTFGFTISKGWIPLETAADADIDAQCFFGSVASSADRKSILESVFDATPNDTPLLYLPAWDQLAPDLKYTRSADIADLLIEVTTERDLQLHTNYPATPIIIR